MAKKSTKKQRKIAKVLHEFKVRKLHSGKSGKIVRSRKQAIAIALSVARRMKRKKHKRK